MVEAHLKINPYQSIELLKDLSLRLVVNRFMVKGRVKFSFLLVDPDPGYWYISSWKVKTTNIGLNLKNTFCTLCLWGWGFHVKPAFLIKKKISGDVFFDVLIKGLF